MARTYFGPWKILLDMGSSRHRGLIIAPVNETNRNNLGICFRSSIKQCYIEYTNWNRLLDTVLQFDDTFEKSKNRVRISNAK